VDKEQVLPMLVTLVITSLVGSMAYEYFHIRENDSIYYVAPLFLGFTISAYFCRSDKK
jgi:hypothetical protein